MGGDKRKRDISGGESLSHNPFGMLGGLDVPAAETGAARPSSPARRESVKPGRRGRVEIRREKSGRGGKTVTTATGFQRVCPAEQQAWVAHLKKQCGAGGTCRPGTIEIQGDRRDDLVRFFEERGFRPVLAGG